MKWEYQLANGRLEAMPDLQVQLNALGRAGWEAVSLTHRAQAQDDVTVLLKRKRRPGQPPGSPVVTTKS